MFDLDKKGFTLIELLIVIGIIAILAAAVIIAINPGQQFEQARNSTRRSDMNSIANAVYSYTVANQGEYPDCDGGLDDDQDNWIDVSDCDELTEDYISDFPTDPSDDEDYQITLTDGGNAIELRSNHDEWADQDNIVQ